MKKLIIGVIIILAVIFLGVESFKLVKVDVENPPKVEDENKDEIQEKSGDMVIAFFNQKNIWENTDLMIEGGIAGIYKTGYCFFDIDLDGQKELAVQLGGGTMHNCTTEFYKYEDGNVKLMQIFEEGYSISVNELKRFKDISGEKFYINKYTLKADQMQYVTNIDKIYSYNNQIVVQNIFSIEENYNENSEVTYVYRIGNQVVDNNKYYSSYENYFYNIDEEIIVGNFIGSEDWKTMNDIEKKEALAKSYSDEDTIYVNSIKLNVIEPSYLIKNKVIDDVLDETIYGEDLKDFKETFGTTVSAEVFTDEKTFVKFIPTSDFLNTENYYYENGKLVAYIKEFIGIGGKAEYYFKDGKEIYINDSEVESEMNFIPEEESDILKRAENVYTKYIK